MSLDLKGESEGDIEELHGLRGNYGLCLDLIPVFIGINEYYYGY